MSYDEENYIFNSYLSICICPERTIYEINRIVEYFIDILDQLL